LRLKITVRGMSSIPKILTEYNNTSDG
jgi:hypothetical protein